MLIILILFLFSFLNYCGLPVHQLHKKDHANTAGELFLMITIINSNHKQFDFYDCLRNWRTVNNLLNFLTNNWLAN